MFPFATAGTRTSQRTAREVRVHHKKCVQQCKRNLLKNGKMVWASRSGFVYKKVSVMQGEGGFNLERGEDLGCEGCA